MGRHEAIDQFQSARIPLQETGRDASDIAPSARILDYRAWRASHMLDQRAPHLSSLSQRHLRVSERLAGLIGPPLALGLLQPGLVLILAGHLLWAGFAGLVAFRILLLLVATTPGFERPPRGTLAGNRELPVYTVMIPLYREARAVSGLSQALSRIDWPGDRLDLILLTESGDPETIAAVAAARWPGRVQHLTLPKGAPQTKPRALNYGLQAARGQYVCVFDAEDRPHPRQLRAVHEQFQKSDDRLTCVQAPLAAYNHRCSWLSLHWASEYAVQFGLLLPALARLRLPILLGGTSNHFLTARLREMHGWDAWNVTEDADLGVRLARRGWRSAVIALPTLEEAPERLGIWTAQRSRWLKGFLQTWVVLMNDSAASRRELGLTGFLTVQVMLLGTLLAALLHGPMALWLLASWWLGHGALPTGALWLLGLGLGANALAVFLAPGPKGLRRALAALTLPFYWPLHTFAAIRALYGWLNAPHFWAKTPHGLTAHPG